MLLSLAMILLAQTPTYPPATTTVAILPTVNISGDKYKAMVADQDKEADKTLRRLFQERGFIVLPDDQVARILNDTKIDLSDEDNQRKDVLYGVGKSTGATLLVFTAIVSTMQKNTHNFLTGDTLEGFASMRTWVLDVPNHLPILPGKMYDGRSTMNGGIGSSRQTKAVRLGLEVELRDFLKPYPKVKKAESAPDPLG